MSLTVTAVDDAPVAQDQSAAIDERTVLQGTLVATDVDSTSLSFVVVTGAAHGALVVDLAGTFTYTPDVHFVGADSFTFRANDGLLDSNVATVTITVRDVTPPELTLPADQVFEATSAAGAVVHYAGATATDDSPPVTFEYSQPNDSLFALGSTLVEVTATDAAGNASHGSFTVTVRDTTPPVLAVAGGSDGGGDERRGCGRQLRGDGDRCGVDAGDHVLAAAGHDVRARHDDRDRDRDGRGREHHDGGVPRDGRRHDAAGANRAGGHHR